MITMDPGKALVWRTSTRSGDSGGACVQVAIFSSRIDRKRKK